MKRTLSLLLTGAVLALSAPAVAGRSTVAEQVAPIFAGRVAPDAPGLAVAVIKDGKIVFDRGYGSAQLEYGVPITGRTVFHVASLSKQFTAFAALLLVQEGKLDLDAEVQRYLPWVPRFEHPITLRQLIHHTSGLHDSWALLGIAGWKPGDVVRNEDLRWILSNQTTLNFTPGSRHDYGNMGYFVLAEVVASVSGMSFAEFSRVRIFEPLGMKNTHVHDDPTRVVPNRAYSYEVGPDGRWHTALLNYGTGGPTCLLTTTEDMMLWLDNFRTAKVGGRALVEQMQQTGVLNDGSSAGYAYGLTPFELGGRKILGHGGADAGFRSQMVWVPDANLGIAVFANYSDAVPAQDVTRVAAVLLGGPVPPALAPAGPRADTAGVAGDYLSSAGIPFTIKPDGTLRIKGRTWPLVQTGPGQMMAAPANVILDFKGDEVGFVYFGIPLSARLATTFEALPASDVQPYVGLYRAAEIGSYFELAIDRQGRPVLRNGKMGEAVLTPYEPDLFVSEQMAQLRFRRDVSGRVIGFSAPTFRIPDGVLFEKVR